MRQIFSTEEDEQFFRENGYLIFDLLGEKAIQTLWTVYTQAFDKQRDVYEFAENLSYYISIFDKDTSHKREVDIAISEYVFPLTDTMMIDYEVFYSNFMIKFPGDGQIEAHQDFNFVNESEHTAFNLWCPLVDTYAQNGGLYVIPGSHRIFRTQRGPNLPKALTQYNQLLKKYACLIPLKKGQAIIFDHKLVHYSPPNYTDQVRVAIQSVLKPAETPPLHYFFDQQTKHVKAYRIDKSFILSSNLWEGNTQSLVLDHEQELIPFPEEEEVVRQLVQLRLESIHKHKKKEAIRSVFYDKSLQKDFEENGFVKLSLLHAEEVRQLKEVFTDFTGGEVENTDYGMYISLEEDDLMLKQQLITKISSITLPQAEKHFTDCKPHLGSFLVKAPGATAYTYPHQDWTFVDAPPSCSITIWIALVDTDETNGALGFVKGSHLFFDKPIGSPSPEFQTCTSGHEDLLYEYLEFVPLKAGEAIAFDNRTIHGATPNTTNAHRIAVAMGMTPNEAPLYHYYLLPGGNHNGQRRIAKFRADQLFFQQYSVGRLKELFFHHQQPEGYTIEEIIEEEFIPFSRNEIQQLCEQAGLQKNGKHLVFPDGGKEKVSSIQKAKASVLNALLYGPIAGRIRNFLFKSQS